MGFFKFLKAAVKVATLVLQVLVTIVTIMENHQKAS